MRGRDGGDELRARGRAVGRPIVAAARLSRRLDQLKAGPQAELPAPPSALRMNRHEFPRALALNFSEVQAAVLGHGDGVNPRHFARFLLVVFPFRDRPELLQTPFRIELHEELILWWCCEGRLRLWNLGPQHGRAAADVDLVILCDGQCPGRDDVFPFGNEPSLWIENLDTDVVAVRYVHAAF